MNLLELLKVVFAATIILDFLAFFLYVHFYTRRKRSSMFQVFILLFGCIAFWETMLWIEFFVATPTKYQLFIDQLAYASGTVFALLAIHFMWQLVHRNGLSKWVIRTTTFIFLVMCCITLVPGWVLQGREYFSQAPYNYAVIPGPLLPIFYGVIGVTPAIIGFLLLKGVKRIPPLERMRALIVGGGLFCIVIFAVMTSIWIQLADYFLSGSFTIGAELGTVITQVSVGIFISVFTFSSAYAIGRYRFMGVHIVLRKNVFAFTVIAVIFLVIAALSYLLGRYVQTIFFGLPLFIPLFAVLFLRSRLKASIDGFFFFNDLDISKKLSADAAQLSSTKRLEEYLEDFVRTAKEKHDLVIRRVFMLQRQHDRFSQVYPMNKKRVVPTSVVNADTFSDYTQIFSSKREPSIAKRFGFTTNEMFMPVAIEGRVVAFFSCQPVPGASKDQQDAIHSLTEEISFSMGPLLYWYESIEGLKRKLNNDIYESV